MPPKTGNSVMSMLTVASSQIGKCSLRRIDTGNGAATSHGAYALTVHRTREHTSLEFTSWCAVPSKECAQHCDDWSGSARYDVLSVSKLFKNDLCPQFTQHREPLSDINLFWPSSRRCSCGTSPRRSSSSSIR